MNCLTRLSTRIARGLAILILALGLLVSVRNAFALSTVDTQHPGVGALVYRRLSGELRLFCSGTLIAPQVFLTAGHCTDTVEWWLSQGLIQAAYVSFDTQFSQDASLVNVASLVTDPDYSPAYLNINSDTHDLGVVLLAAPVTDRPLTALPAANLLDALRLSPKSPVTAVGYGVDTNDVHGTPPSLSYTDTGIRTSGILSYRALTHAFITVTQLPNQGSDNVCFGDSGGPDFVQINGQEQLVAISVVVNSYSCEEVAWLYRLDTPQARAFLGQYVALP